MNPFKQLTTEELFEWPLAPPITCPIIDNMKKLRGDRARLDESSMMFDVSEKEIEAKVDILELWATHYMDFLDELIEKGHLSDPDVIFEVQNHIEEATKYIENNKIYELSQLYKGFSSIVRQWDKLSSAYEGFESDLESAQKALKDKEEELYYCQEEDVTELRESIHDLQTEVNELQMSLHNIDKEFQSEVVSEAESIIDNIDPILEDIRHNNENLRTSTREMKTIAVNIIRTRDTGYDLAQPAAYLEKFCHNGKGFPLGILNDESLNRVIIYLIENKVIEEEHRFSNKERLMDILCEKFNKVYYYKSNNHFINDKDNPTSTKLKNQSKFTY